MGSITAIATGLALPIVAAWLLGRRRPAKAIKMITRGFLTLNAMTAIALGTLMLIWLIAPPPTMAAGPMQGGGNNQANVSLGAALAVGMATIGAGIAVGLVGAAAAGAVAEKPEVFGRVLIFVGLAEGIAIYGLIVSFMILTGGVR